MTTTQAFDQIGSVTATRIHEWIGELFPRPVLLPDSDRADWEVERSWLVPEFWSPDSENAWMCAQSFLLRSGGRTILLDTGIGNGKARPGIPPWDDMDNPFLDTLRAAGVAPAEVDLVINTHLHPDHIGWNTQFIDGAWQPTFPNATYLMPRVDYEFFAEMGASEVADPFSYGAAFADSIEPIRLNGGNVQLWEGDEHVIDGALRLMATPGHSPGACVLVVSSDGENAVFASDTVHHPMQILDPDQRVLFDFDDGTAAKMRRKVLSWAAEHRAPVIPYHFPNGRGVRIQDRDGRFQIDSWIQVPGPAAR